MDKSHPPVTRSRAATRNSPQVPRSQSRKRRASNLAETANCTADAPSSSTASSTPERSKRHSKGKSAAKSSGSVSASGEQPTARTAKSSNASAKVTAKRAQKSSGRSQRHSKRARGTTDSEQPTDTSEKDGSSSGPSCANDHRVSFKSSATSNKHSNMASSGDMPEDDAGERGASAAAAADEDDIAATTLQGLLARLAGGNSAAFSLMSELAGAGHHGLIGGGASSRYKQLLQDLAAEDEEFKQEAALRKVTEMLLMGTEETLGGFRPDQFVPALHHLLECEHRPQVALLACEALCNMLEAIPSCSDAVAQHCAPALCAKLLNIEYIDLAERALTTIGKLVIDQGEALLQAGGINSALTFLDFFPIALQRTALQTAVKMCAHVTVDKFHLVQDSLRQLSTFLTYQDRTLVEAACDCYSHLVVNLSSSSELVGQLTQHSLLPNLLCLITTTPPIIGRSSISVVVKILSTVLKTCPDLATMLHGEDVGATIRQMLVNVAGGAGSSNADASKRGDLSVGGNTSMNATAASNTSQRAQSASSGTHLNASAEQLCEFMDLVYELLPSLPEDVIYAKLPPMPTKKSVTWQWKDGQRWHDYAPGDSDALEEANTSGRGVHAFQRRGESYAVNFTDMQQVNRMTRKKRPIRRVETISSGSVPHSVRAGETDPRATFFKENEHSLQVFVEPLVAPLFNLFLSTADADLKLRTLRAITKMLHFSTPAILRETLANLSISSYLTNILRLDDADLVAGALQIADDLIVKVPEIFAVYFRRHGVLFEICRLARNADDAEATASASAATDTTNAPINAKSRKMRSPRRSKERASAVGSEANAASSADDGAGSGTDVDFDATEAQATAARHAYVSVTARELLRSRFDVSGSAILNPLDDPHEALDLLRRLDALAKRLDPTVTPAATSDDATMPGTDVASESGSTEGADTALLSLAKILADDTVVASSFELWCSGVLTALLNFLTQPGTASSVPRLERIKQFCSKFFVPSEDGFGASNALSTLVELTQGIVVLTEQFKSTCLPNNDSFVHMLKTPLKLKLERAPDSVLRDMNAQLVMIEPFASIEAIEDFLWPRVKVSQSKIDSAVARRRQVSGRRGDANGGSASSPAATPTSGASETSSSDEAARSVAEAFLDNMGMHDEEDVEEDEDVDDDHEEDDEEAGYSTSTRSRTRSNMVDLAAMMEDDGTGAGRASGSSRLESDDVNDDGVEDDLNDVTSSGLRLSTSRSARKRRVDVLIGDNLLPSNITIYQAISQFGNNGADVDSKPVSGLRRRRSSSSSTGSSASPQRERHESFGGARLGNDKVFGVTYCEAGHVLEPRRERQTSTCELVTNSTSGDHPIEKLVAPPLQSFMTSDDPVYPALCLLRVLYILNNKRHILPNADAHAHVELIHSSEFVNNTLAAKITQQVSDLQTICAGSFPNWCREMVTSFPFLVPFECKNLFFLYTAFGSVRALVFYQQVNNIPEDDPNDRALPARISRVKVKISRRHLLKSTFEIMRSYAANKSIIEIVFQDEIGSGLGPTLEFYSLASKAWQRDNLKLWLSDTASAVGEIDSAKPADATDESKDVTLSDNATDDAGEKPSRSDIPTKSKYADDNYVYAPNGLFPIPWSKDTSDSATETTRKNQLSVFDALGRFLARAILDGRLLDMSFNKCFLMWLINQEGLFDLSHVKLVDESLWKSLTKLITVCEQFDTVREDATIDASTRATQLAACTLDGCSIEDLCLSFTLPGHDDIELCEGGATKDVTLENLREYVNAIVEMTLVTGVERQMHAVIEGFEKVFPLTSLYLFSADELDKVICGSDPHLWDSEELLKVVKADHGYSSASPQLTYLCDVMSSFDRDQQRLFLSFITGCPNLPVGGFKSLHPKLTVVRKSVSKPDDELPSVMTCQNYLKLPPYTSEAVLRERVITAMTEGQGSFLLS